MSVAGDWGSFADTYDTERLKTLSVWSACLDEDVRFRTAERAGARQYSVTAPEPGEEPGRERS